jgi:hypothetical protein
MRYDRQAIVDSINMLDVINKLNIKISNATAGTDIVTGNKREIICPFHNDKHFGSASIYVDSKKHFKGIHCFACGESWNVIKLVQLKTGLNYGQTLNWLAELCPGDKSNYALEEANNKSSWGIVSIDSSGKLSVKNNNSNEEKSKAIDNPIKNIFTSEDLKLIGIQDYPLNIFDKNGSIIDCLQYEPSIIDIPDNCVAEKDYVYSTDKKASNVKFDETLEAVWLIKKNGINSRFTFNDLIQENPDCAVNLACTRIVYLIKDKQVILNKLAGSSNKMLVNVVHLTKKEIKRLKELYNKIMNAWLKTEELKIEYI